jgi:hypothetical protein
VRDKKQETRDKRQEKRDKRQETRDKKQNIRTNALNSRLFAFVLFILSILLLSAFAFAQTDTLPKKIVTKKKQGQNPREAALRAAVLPGWGQLYNKKYWKLPLVYGGAAAIGYGIYWNNAQYQFFRNTYQEAFLSGNPLNINLQAAEVLRNQFRRNKEQLIIAGVVFYGLTIVDAIVDAHFSTYDVSDDLSLRWFPKIDFSPQGQNYLAFTLQLQRKK